MHLKKNTQQLVPFVNYLLFIIFFLVVINGNSQTTCEGTVVNITFGNGALNPGPQLSTEVPGASTTYHFASYATGNPPVAPVDGDYALINKVPQNGAWYTGATDHTGDPNGYMAFFNASPIPGAFYKQNIIGLSPDVTYEFSSWIANVINPAVLPTAVLPNITFEILDTTTQAVLASYNTGDIQNSTSMKWIRYSLLFTVPKDLSAVTLKLSNNNIGGNEQPGNDLAIDDIIFSPCIFNLPLVLKSFQGNIINKSALLTWTTFKEVNTAFNIIERSYDGFNFTAISSLPAIVSLQENKYKFTDYPSFSNRTVFYRLKLVDKDGKYTNSNVLVFALGTKVSGGIKLSPNPAKFYVQMAYTSDREAFTTIKITDITGKIAMEQSTHLSKGENYISIKLQNKLNKGVYFVQCFSNGKNFTGKLVIN